MREVVPLLPQKDGAERAASRRDVFSEGAGDVCVGRGRVDDLVADERKRRVAVRPDVHVVDARRRRVAVEEKSFVSGDARGAEEAHVVALARDLGEKVRLVGAEAHELRHAMERRGNDDLVEVELVGAVDRDLDRCARRRRPRDRSDLRLETNVEALCDRFPDRLVSGREREVLRGLEALREARLHEPAHELHVVEGGRGLVVPVAEAKHDALHELGDRRKPVFCRELAERKIKIGLRGDERERRLLLGREELEHGGVLRGGREDLDGAVAALQELVGGLRLAVFVEDRLLAGVRDVGDLVLVGEPEDLGVVGRREHGSELRNGAARVKRVDLATDARVLFENGDPAVPELVQGVGRGEP